MVFFHRSPKEKRKAEKGEKRRDKSTESMSADLHYTTPLGRKRGRSEGGQGLVGVASGETDLVPRKARKCRC